MPPRQTKMIPKRLKLAPTRSNKNTKTIRDDPEAAHGGPTQEFKIPKAILLRQSTNAAQRKTHPIRGKKFRRQAKLMPKRFKLAPTRSKKQEDDPR